MAPSPKKNPTTPKPETAPRPRKDDVVAPERLIVMRPLVFNRAANAAHDPKVAQQRAAAQEATQALVAAFAAWGDGDNDTLDTLAVEKALKAGANINAAVNELGQTPLHVAVSEGDHAAVALLLRAGANTRARDHEGFTPLIRALRESDEAMSGMLARAEERPEAQTLKGRHAIHDAASQGYAEAIEGLIARGLSPTIRDIDGDSPLMEALKAEKADGIFSLAYGGGLQQGMLKQYKAAFDGSGGYELSDYDISAFLKAALAASPQTLKPQPVTLPPKLGLKEAELFLHIANRDGDGAALLLKKRPDLQARNAAGDTPLLAALRRGAMRVADMIAAKSDVNAAGAFGCTPLHHAAAGTGRDSRQMLLNLINLGGNVNVQDTRGQTPLIKAAMSGLTDNVQLLLDNKAKLDIKDKLGMSALDHAHYAADADTIEMLENAVARKAKTAKPAFKTAAKPAAKTTAQKKAVTKPLQRQAGRRY